jgi:hypothetical protein
MPARDAARHRRQTSPRPTSGSSSAALWQSVGRMRRAVLLFLALAAPALLAGCGGSGSAADDTPTSTAAAVRTTPADTTTTTSTPAASNSAAHSRSGFVVVTSLLGKQLPKEPQCRFADNFVPDRPTNYDGSLTLTVTCEKSDGYQPVGQIVDRAGSKPTEITCRDTSAGQLYCVYVPSSSVGLYFTGTDRAVVRRRLQHLIELVAPLPTGITPMPGTSTP